MIDYNIIKEAGFDVCVLRDDVRIITEGVFFDVIIFEDIVIKIPKKDTNNFKEPLDLQVMVDVQNYLAKNMSEVQPALFFKNYVITKKATGIRSDFIKDNKFRDEFSRKIKIITKKIEDLGVEIADITRCNVFIDGDRWQLIDFSGARFKKP